MDDLKHRIVEIDLEGVKRKIAKFPSNIPLKLEKIPTPEEESELFSLIKGNAIWLILTYGASLVSLISPAIAKILKALIRWKFNWESKDIPFIG